MSHVVEVYKRCAKCQKLYTMGEFEALPTTPVQGWVRESPMCPLPCGSIEFRTEDDSDDDE